jgi:hypothetical protein
MDLDELKNTWMVLDERLKKNEMLNKQIIQEMIYKKSNKSLHWLVSYDILSIPVLLLVIPFCIWAYTYPYALHTVSSKILLIAAIIICILGVIWYCYKLKYLAPIDFSKGVGDNMHFVNKYSILVKKEKNVQFFVVGPIIALILIIVYYEHKANLFWWSFLSTVLILTTIGTYWIYKKVYDSNIQSIRKSLEELKELKEE